ncbi:hypothetical protein [Burkholderia diffusa]|uniref:hypothetical protein n=1 Tax=Burkholderia diffusa TaxID=488732 RepID=UPI00157B62B4|nr:hypothetical protein [Burkholderia diffusa]NTY39853.1 hypothetical protein [Burkholderia diffusa]
MNVMRAYRYRGRRNQQIYLTYSVKTERDWIFPSNLRFLHWILYLETDPEVATFDVCDDIARAPDTPGIHAIATMRNGRTVGHRIVSDKSEKDSQLPRPDPFDLGREVRLIPESELREQASLAIRWVKVICFAGALRDQRLDAATMLISGIAQSMGSGTVQQILEAAPNIDDAIAKGMIARLAITGWLRLDLSHRGYTRESPWRWEGPE